MCTFRLHSSSPFFPWCGSADRRGLALCSNFDNSVQRIKMWVSDKPSPAASAALSPSSSSAQLAGLGTIAAGIANPTSPDGGAASVTLSSGQRKRVKQYLKRCRMNPRHSQLNLEGYLLLPVQRIPRYRLLVSVPPRLVLDSVSLRLLTRPPGQLEELVRSSPPAYAYMDDPIDRALTEISALANTMNEGKRESESRQKLVQWQGRIRGRFPSPLVQPHR